MATPTNPKSSSPTSPTSTTPTGRDKLIKRLILWFVFSIFMGVLPVILNILLLIRDSKPIKFFDLFAHGELLIIAFAVATSSISDLLNGNKFGDTPSIIAFCLSFIILVISACLWASLGIESKASNIVWFGIISLILYGLGTSLGAWSQFLGER